MLAACSALAVGGLLVGSPGAGARGDAKPVGTIVFSAGEDLFTVHADGSHYRQLTDGPTSEESPSWAPDGRWFVYVRVKGNGALYRMKAAGGKPRFLYRNPSSEDEGIITLLAPSWSPDGRRIAFSSTRSGETWTVWTYSLDGRLVQVTRTFSVHPSWSPNGRRIAYGGLDGVSIVGLDGSGKRDVPNTSGADGWPAWSPDGKWIAVRTLNADWRTHEADSLDIVNPAGTIRRRLFTGNGALFPESWSPTSDAVLVLRAIGTPPNTRTQLFIVPLAGGRPRPVDGTNGAGGGASWHR